MFIITTIWSLLWYILLAILCSIQFHKNYLSLSCYHSITYYHYFYFSTFIHSFIIISPTNTTIPQCVPFSVLLLPSAASTHHLQTASRQADVPSAPSPHPRVQDQTTCAPSPPWRSTDPTNNISLHHPHYGHKPAFYQGSQTDRHL